LTISFFFCITGQIVANAAESERAAFIKRCYLHLGGAIAAYAVVVTLFLQTGIANAFMGLLSGTPWAWLLVMGAYMGVSVLADNWARSGVSRERQYMGLGLYIVAFAFISTLPITRAIMMDPSILTNAALITAALVGGLTFTAFSTKINFSFMGRFLMIGGFVAMGVIVAAILFGFSLGLWFSGAMILFAAASVLYSTSNIIHEYHTDQHVAASLSLFSSVGLLFWYVIQFLMAFTGND
jgi:FtsH-binding integral membrane protein